MNKDSRIYIAGHRGLVGSAIVRKLESEGYNNLITKTHEELDLMNQRYVQEFFEREKPEYIFLAAAKVGGIYANNTFPADFIYENLQIQNNVIFNAYKFCVKKLLFLGSSCIYPSNCPQPIKEEYLLTSQLEKTNEPYAISKIAGIKMCQSFNRQYGTNFIAAMPTNLYGPNDNFDLEKSHVLPALIRKFSEAIKNNSDQVVVWGSGEVRREFLYVDDLADALIFLINNYNTTDYENERGDIFINIGTGKDQTIHELVLILKDISGFDGRIIYDLSKPDGVKQKVLDVSKMSKMGWKAKIGLEEGLKKTYEWYCTNEKAKTNNMDSLLNNRVQNINKW